MPRGAYLVDASVLEDLSGDLSRYLERSQQALVSLTQTAEKTLEELSKRVDHWQKQVERCEQKVCEAENALRRCRFQPADKDGNRPSCGCEEKRVQETLRELNKASIQLETAKRWKQKVSEALGDFRTHSTQFRGSAEKVVSRGKQVLSQKAHALQHYATVAVKNFPKTYVNPRVMSSSAITASKYSVKTIEPKVKERLRRHAVDQAWKQEQELVRHGIGTRRWTTLEIKQLKEEGRVDGYEGHHIRSVKCHSSKWAEDPRNIFFVKKDSLEHFNWHGGNTHNPTTGNLIDREAMLRKVT